MQPTELLHDFQVAKSLLLLTRGTTAPKIVTAPVFTVNSCRQRRLRRRAATSPAVKWEQATIMFAEVPYFLLQGL